MPDRMSPVRADSVCLPAAGVFLADNIAGSAGPAIMIKGAGHAPFLTQPKAFNAALRRVANDRRVTSK